MLSWAIDVSLNEPGAQILADTTAKHIGDQIAIVVDHVVLSAPVIASAIDVGELGITGDFTEASAKKLAKEIKQTSMSVRQVLATRPAG
jgi:preprotein translocase subunit SecD